jgi:hypothetical protein
MLEVKRRSLDWLAVALQPDMHHEERRLGHSSRLATGTLACPRCDAPVALAGPAAPHDRLGCPYCHHVAALRDFLSLEAPSRPARVAVTVRFPVSASAARTRAPRPPAPR